MKKVFTLFASSPKKLLIEFIIFTLLISTFDLGGVYILGSVMTTIFSPEFSSAGGVINVGSYLISYQIIAAIFLTRMFSIAFCNYWLGRTIFKIAGNYSSQIFNKSIVNSSYRQHASSDDKSAVIAVDTNVVLNTFLIPLCRLVTEVLVIAGIFAFLATISLKITIVAIFLGVLSVAALQISLGYISAKLGLLRQIAEKNRIEGVQRAADFNLLIDSSLSLTIFHPKYLLSLILNLFEFLINDSHLTFFLYLYLCQFKAYNISLIVQSLEHANQPDILYSIFLRENKFSSYKYKIFNPFLIST